MRLFHMMALLYLKIMLLYVFVTLACVLDRIQYFRDD